MTNGITFPKSTKGRNYEEIYGVEKALEIKSKLRISHLNHVAWNKGIKSGPRPEALKIRQRLRMKERIKYGESKPYGSKGITDEDILNLWHKGLTAIEISRRLGCSDVNLLNRLGKLAVSRTDIKGRCRRVQSEKMKEERKHWNPVDSPEVRKKISNSIKELYKDPEYKNHCTFIHFSDDERREYAQLGFIASHKRPTSIESRINDLINENFLPYRYVGDGSLWIAGMNPDFIHKHKDFVVEVLGNHWHTREETDKRRERFNKSGFGFIEIWESELKMIPENEIVIRLSI